MINSSQMSSLGPAEGGFALACQRQTYSWRMTRWITTTVSASSWLSILAKKLRLSMSSTVSFRTQTRILSEANWSAGLMQSLRPMQKMPQFKRSLWLHRSIQRDTFIRVEWKMPWKREPLLTYRVTWRSVAIMELTKKKSISTLATCLVKATREWKIIGSHGCMTATITTKVVLFSTASIESFWTRASKSRPGISRSIQSWRLSQTSLRLRWLSSQSVATLLVAIKTSSLTSPWWNCFMAKFQTSLLSQGDHSCKLTLTMRIRPKRIKQRMSNSKKELRPSEASDLATGPMWWSQ